MSACMIEWIPVSSPSGSALWISIIYWAEFEPNLYLEKDFCFQCSFSCLPHDIFYYTSVPLNKYLQRSLCSILTTTSQLQGMTLAMWEVLMTHLNNNPRIKGEPFLNTINNISGKRCKADRSENKRMLISVCIYQETHVAVWHLGTFSKVYIFRWLSC